VIYLIENPRTVQVIGCAYTYRVSRSVRDKLARGRRDHSSHQGASAFSYFKKAEQLEDVAFGDGDRLRGHLLLRRHPETGAAVDHWYEPELAFILGPRHEIAAYGLANDLTAATIEFEKAREGFDPTYFGKCWEGGCGMGRRFLRPHRIDNIDKIEIGLRIVRGNKVIYNRSYSTSQRLRDFADFPGMILARREELARQGVLPPSKQIIVDSDGFLPEGTRILAGTGLITPRSCYARVGDTVTIWSPQLGEFTNFVRSEH
jgi:hypothetical protein